MIDRNGNYFCGWCGDPMRKRKRWELPSECCSETCAKSYAADADKPNEWREFFVTRRACSACGKPKEHDKFRWCLSCKEAWRSSKVSPSVKRSGGRGRRAAGSSGGRPSAQERP